jgi:hypothetical protein
MGASEASAIRHQADMTTLREASDPALCLRTVTLRLVHRRLLGTLVLSTPHSTRRITTLAFVAVDLACASADGLGVGTESVV